jgi:hypothetical protein
MLIMRSCSSFLVLALCVLSIQGCGYDEPASERRPPSEPKTVRASVATQTDSTLKDPWASTTADEHLAEIKRLRKAYYFVLQTDLELQLRHAEYAVRLAPSRKDALGWRNRIQGEILERELRSGKSHQLAFQACVSRLLEQVGPREVGAATRLVEPEYQYNKYQFRVNVASKFWNKFGALVTEVHECNVKCSSVISCKATTIRKVE